MVPARLPTWPTPCALLRAISSSSSRLRPSPAPLGLSGARNPLFTSAPHRAAPTTAARPKEEPAIDKVAGRRDMMRGGKRWGQKKERVVVLGSGWAGYTLVRDVDTSKYDVTIVSPNTYFSFTPLLAQATTGVLLFRSAIEPVRTTVDVHFLHAWCDAIDFRSKRLTLMPAYPPTYTDGQSPVGGDAHTSGLYGHHRAYELEYDKLVISVGCYNATFGTPGVKEHGHFLKDVQNAKAIRWRVMETLEQASNPNLSDDERRKLLHFVCVGGGPTGVEVAAELYDLVRTDLPRTFPALAPLVNVTLFDAAPTILNAFDQSLRAYAMDQFSRDGVDIRTGVKIKKVENGKLHIEGDEPVHFGILIWATGLSPNPLIESITEIAKQPKTQSLLTDSHLRALSAPSSESEKPTPMSDVFALGDCAQVDGYPTPATAQVAVQKAAYLAQLLNRLSRSDSSPPSSPSSSPPPTEKELGEGFQWKNMGAMTSLGSGRAILDMTQSSNPVINKESGRIAWLVWRSYYLYSSLSWRNRLMVLGSWILTGLFGRDHARF